MKLLILLVFIAFQLCFTQFKETDIYKVEVLERIPHSTSNFVQGLFFKDGFLYESNGLKGKSTLKKIDAKTGEELESLDIRKYFCEGIAELNGKIYQLTWQDKIAFIYNNEFKLLKEIKYRNDGWGITSNGKNLICSDGSAEITFRSRLNLKEIKKITVRNKGKEVKRLNELEYVDGKIYANIWNTDSIAIIDPKGGRVSGFVVLGEDFKMFWEMNTGAVPNGIAWDKKEKAFYITGKLWPWIFKVRFIKE